jgi:hypothetical protein
MQTMTRFKFYSILLIAIFLFSLSPGAAQSVPGNDFPYTRLTLNIPPREAPYPGLGNYYSALSKGLETVMWNPASLTEIEYAQGKVSFLSGPPPYQISTVKELEDGQIDLGDQSEINIGYYLTDDETVTTAATREHTSHYFYRARESGIQFKQAIRANDWLSFGILSHSQAGGSIDVSGIFPAVTKSETNFLNKSNILGSGLSIDNSGFLTYTYTPESGGSYEYSTTDTLWAGFLNQSSTVPLNVILESRNDVNIYPGTTFSGAMKWEKLSFGVNFTPISANANINNTARAVINDGTADVYIYQPDFDPEDESAALNWIQDPNLYGSESGYKRNTINVPAGETIAEARFKGFYQASTLQGDLGLNYEVFEDVLSVGLVLENFTGSNLDFRGRGRVAYVNSKVGTEEPGGFEPGQEFTWSPFRDDFEAVEGTEDFYLPPSYNVALPKKLRLGLVLRKPFLIALDYEQNQTPIVIQQYEDSTDQITVSNINFLRIGIETQLFALPVWLRGGTALLFKPNIEGATQEAMDNIDDIFRFGVLPASLDLGLETNIYGTRVGTDVGANATSALSLYQLDSLNQDIGKIGYYDVYVARGPWKVTYMAIIDPKFFPALGYKLSTSGEDSDFDFDDFAGRHLKWIQTVSVSYIF